MRCLSVSIRPPTAAAVVLAALVAVTLAPGPLVAQTEAGESSNDWQVEGGDARKAEVIRRYKQLLEKSPNRGVVFEKLVEYVGKGEGLDRLVAEYERRVEESPEQANLRLVLGHLLDANGDPEAASTHYDKAVELRPEDPVAWMSRGRVRSKLEQTKKAISDFETALEHVGKRARKQEILRKLADLAFQQHQWNRAIGYYQRLIEMDPSNEYLRMEFAQVLVKHRRYEEAVAQYEKLLELAGRDPKAKATTLRDMGDVYEKMGEAERAVETYRRAMNLMRRSHWLYEELQQRVIDVYRNDDRLAELVGEYESRWGSPDYSRSLLLGKLSDEIGREDQALEYFRRATRRKPGEPTPRKRVIEILRRRGEDKEAIAEYKKLMRAAPDESRYHFELVRLYFQLGQRDEGVELLDTIKRRFRGQPTVYVTLADTYMRYEMEEEALATYRELVEMEPDNESYILSLGESYYRAGHMEKAVETWQRLLETSMPTAEAHARLGQVYSEHGMIERGVRNYRKAVELRPDDLSIRRGLASTYERARRWNKAIEAWRAIMEQTDQSESKAEARGRIISIYERQHRLRSMLTEFRKRFEADTPDRQAGYFLAEGHLKLNNYEKAEQTYRTLIEADGEVGDNDIEAFQALERIYRQTGELENAIEVLQKLADLQPERQRDYYHQIAELSLQLYQDDQAVRYAALAVEKNPDDADAHARLGEVYRKMQKLEAAAEEYRRAFELDPKAHRHAMALAEILVTLGDKRRAEELYRQVAREAEGNSMVLKAARRAIDLADENGRLGELESEFSKLAFRGSENAVYRKVLLELYERMVTPLMLSMRYGVGDDRATLRERLERIGQRASPVLMTALNDGNIGQRALAVRLLGGLRDSSGALQLARMTVDPEESLRTLAAISVAEIGDERAAGPLVQGLDADDPTLREIATWTLGYVGGDEAIEALVEQLHNGQNWTEKALAAIGLGRIGGDRAVDALETAILTVPPGESNDGVLVAVTWALGRVGDADSIETLEDALRRSPRDVQFVAARALAEIGGDAAIRALLAARWDERSALRAPAMRGLARGATRMERETGDHAQLRRRSDALMADISHIAERDQKIDVQGLIQRRKVDSTVAGVTRSDAFFRKYASVAAEVAGSRLDNEKAAPGRVLADLWQSGRLRLGMLEPATAAGRKAYIEALGALREPLASVAEHDDPEVAAPAIGLLGRLGGADNAASLIGRLSSEAAAVRAAAARSIGRLGDPSRAIEPLSEAMDDSDFDVRRAVSESLADIATSSVVSDEIRDRVIGLLGGALEDDYRSVRLAAVRGLGRIGGERAAEALVERLEALDIDLRAEALAVLTGMEVGAAREAVESYRDHPDYRLRRAIEGAE